jgi:hypothetical protein
MAWAPPRLIAMALASLVVAGAGQSVAQGGGDCIAIENFAKGKVGEFPPGWKVRKDAGMQVYSVREEDGRRFLRAHAKGHGIQAAKQYEWDLNAYPILAWTWRPREFPQGAHEQEGKNDSTLAVYMLVDHSRVRGPKAVKYIWSERVPVGTRLNSNNGLTQVRVVRSGADSKGQWVEERVNVRDDYLKFFGEKEVPKPAGVAVLTDSDDTDSSAQGDYANIRACRQ